MMAWAITISGMGRTAPIRRYSTDDPYSIFVGGALFSCWRDASAHLRPGSATRGAAVPGAMVGRSRSHSRRWTAGIGGRLPERRGGHLPDSRGGLPQMQLCEAPPWSGDSNIVADYSA